MSVSESTALTSTSRAREPETERFNACFSVMSRLDPISTEKVLFPATARSLSEDGARRGGAEMSSGKTVDVVPASAGAGARRWK